MENQNAVVTIEPSPIVAYNKTAEDLSKLINRTKDVVYDVTNAKGMAEAKMDRMACVRMRSALEVSRQAEKQDVLARGRLIDSEAKRIREAIEAVEQPVDAQIKQEEARKEAERVAKAEVEAKRVADIRAKMDAIIHMPLKLSGTMADVTEMRNAKDKLGGLEITPYDFGELVPDAQAAKDAALRVIDAMILAEVNRAAELERLRLERVELDRQKAEHEAKVLAETQAREARETAERLAESERIAAERKRLADEMAESTRARAEADRVANEARAKADAEAKAERDRKDAEAAAVRKVEQDRLAAERAESERKAAEVVAELKRKREEQKKRIAAKMADFGKVARMAPFIKSAIEYRDANAEDAEALLVKLCEMYAESKVSA